MAHQFSHPLAQQFTTALTAAGGELHHAANWSAALGVVDGLLEAWGVQSIVINQEAPLDEVDWLGRWPNRACHVVGRTVGDVRQVCATAEVGLSGCVVALAETGTVGVASGPNQSRLATLLPPIHVALVGAHQITADLFSWVASLSSAPPPAHLALVSGPSKTADIEQVMAVGVHGPKRFVVVVWGNL